MEQLGWGCVGVENYRFRSSGLERAVLIGALRDSCVGLTRNLAKPNSSPCGQRFALSAPLARLSNL